MTATERAGIRLMSMVRYSRAWLVVEDRNSDDQDGPSTS